MLKKLSRLTALSVACVALFGCAVGSDYVRPSKEALPDAVGAQTALASLRKGTSLGDAGWWNGFGDATLVELVERAASQNLTLAQAEARIAQARAASSAAQAALTPQVDAQGGLSRTTQSLYSPSSSVSRYSAAYERSFTDRTIGFVSSWELDLFGGNKRALEAANAGLEAAEARTEAIRVSVAAETADAYILLRGAQERLRLIVLQEAAATKAAELSKLRMKEGLATEQEFLRDAAEVDALRAAQRSLRADVQGQTARIIQLVGGEDADMRGKLEAVAAVPVAPALASDQQAGDLVRRRPDVVAAERQLAAAHARVGVALSEYYPKLSLSALVSFDSVSASHLLTDDGRASQIGVGLRWRVFDFGRVDAEVAAARGREAESLIGYRAAMLTAATDIEAAVTGLLQGDLRVEDATAQLTKVRNAQQLSSQAYTAGVASLTTLLAAERSTLTAEDSLVQAKTLRARATLASYRAMAGGWARAPKS